MWFGIAMVVIGALAIDINVSKARRCGSKIQDYTDRLAQLTAEETEEGVVPEDTADNKSKGREVAI